jgi:hypothetical protein
VVAIDLLHLIDRLEEQIGEARRLPIGTGSVVDRRRLLDLVDQLRAAVPAEVREAREIIDRKEDVLAKADDEAAVRLARADEEVAVRVGESEVTKAAEMRGAEIIEEARAEADRIIDDARHQIEGKVAEGERLASEQMDEADRYALEMLRKLEQQLHAFMSSVHSGIETLEKRPPEEMPVPEAVGVGAEPPLPEELA